MAKNQNIADQQELNRLTREYETMLARVNSLRQRIGQNPIKILDEAQIRQLPELEKAIGSLRVEVNYLQEDINATQRSFSSLAGQAKGAATSLNRLGKTIGTIDKKFSSSITSTSKFNDKLKEVASRIRDIVKQPLREKEIDQEINQKVNLADIPTPTSLEQEINQRVNPAETTQPKDLTQKVTPEVGPIESVQPPDLTQTVNQQVNPATPKQPQPLTQEVQQKIVPATSPVQSIVPSTPAQQAEASGKEVEGVKEPVKTTSDIGAYVQEEKVITSIQDTFGATRKEAEEFYQENIKGADRLGVNYVQLTDALNEIKGALALPALNQARNAGRALIKIGQELAAEADGYGLLTQKELENRVKSFTVQKKALLAQKTSLETERKTLEGKKSLTDAENTRLEQIKDTLNLIGDQSNAIKEIEGNLISRLEAEREINSLMGIGGGILKGTNKLLGSLGLNSEIFGEGLREAQDAMRATAVESQRINSLMDRRVELEEEIEKARKGKKKRSHLVAELNNVNSELEGAGSATGRLGVLMSGIPGIAKGIGTALTDPLTIITAIGKEFLKLNKLTVELKRLTGDVSVAFSGLNAKFASVGDLLENSVAITKQLGLAANTVFTDEQIQDVSELKNLLGLSAEEAGKIGLFSKVAGTEIQDFDKAVVRATKSINKTTKGGVAAGVVLSDVANTSEDIALSLGGNPEQIGRAAAAARRFGLELSKVDQIAGSLLDFESSIEKELEATLFTGKQINLAKARELALNNDLEGVVTELAKNGATGAEFAQMNRLEQESLASALGLSRQELGKQIYLQEVQNGLSRDQLGRIMNMNEDQLRSYEIQESINKSIEKMTSALAGPLAAFASLVEVAGVLATVLGVIAGVSFYRLAMSLAGAAVQMGILAAGSIAAGSALSLGIGIAAIVAGIAAGAYALNKIKKEGAAPVKDAVIAPDGGLVVSGPKGSYQLDKNDTVVAGTELGQPSAPIAPISSVILAAPRAGDTPATEVNVDMAAVSNKLDELIKAVKAGGNVYLDGQRVGQSLVLGASKLS